MCFLEIIKLKDFIHIHYMVDQALVEALKSCQAIQYGHFVLTSGAVSDYYIDIKKASTHPQTLDMIATAMEEYTNDCDLIAGMELGAVPLIVALSLHTNIPYVIIRKEKRQHGTGKLIEGGSVKGKRVLVVEDVTTSGGSVLKTVDIIRDHKGDIIRVVSVVDRECGARDLIARHHVDFVPLITISDILD
jgi:orotate phosphoribosyltransferase